LYLLPLNRFDDNYVLHFELPDAIRDVFEETQSRVLFKESALQREMFRNKIAHDRVI